MFIQNKYSNWYFSIIENAKKHRELDYYENHHIIPKCLGGTDNASNIAKLTAKEHFICHLLLTKMHDSSKIKFAVVMMLVSNENHDRYNVNSRTYDRIKKMNSEASKERMVGVVGSNIGRKRYHNPLTGEEKFLKSNDIIPHGFIHGHSLINKQKIGEKNKGGTYYYDPLTLKTIHIDNTLSPPPPGWIKGNPNANTSDRSNLKGSSYYYNPLTGEEVRSSKEIVGWLRGRSVKWITNGIDNKQFNIIKHIIPNGWYLGRSTWR